jgi:hypothetical protein
VIYSLPVAVRDDLQILSPVQNDTFRVQYDITHYFMTFTKVSTDLWGRDKTKGRKKLVLCQDIPFVLLAQATTSVLAKH